jgi:UDP-N-acetylmuramoyl-tripeptide--D-alanyl-D-alanine ligase
LLYFTNEEIPTIAITGSNGKTSTREFIASVLETRWNVLKTVGNKNLPISTQQMMAQFDPSKHEAVLLELGMGKQGAGEQHCNHFQPNISVITNIGTAHYGNLGNSFETTAQYKSVLIKCMKADGLLLLNKDDKNSQLLDTSTFKGTLITIGINSNANYKASNIEYLSNGMRFHVEMKGNNEEFFIPTFGEHNVFNALFAISLADKLGFPIQIIREGLKNYQVPIKRLNVYNLKDESILIDDSVNSNPQSVKAAIDVLVNIGKDKYKIAVLGSMLELGDYASEGHREIGKYAADKKIDVIYTFGDLSIDIHKGAIEHGFPMEKIKHFTDRNELHHELKSSMEHNSIFLVKGSSLMHMNKTAEYLRNNFLYTIKFNEDLKDDVLLNPATFALMKIDQSTIILQYGSFSKTLTILLDDKVSDGEIQLPRHLSSELSIIDLPYEYVVKDNHIQLGPVIGFLVYTRYIEDSKQQLLRLKDYDMIKGLIFMFRPTEINSENNTLTGFYYDPASNEFKQGTFPYPSVVFNRIPLREKRYKQLKKRVGDNIFNYPYRNIDKLTFWDKMKNVPKLKKYLPITKAFTGVKSLLSIFKKYDSVYLKPVSMAGGNGIIQAKKLDEGFLLTDYNGECFHLKSVQELKTILKEHLLNRTYIMQQEIESFTNTGEKIDFRIYIQKDYSMKWKLSGIETKIAKSGSVVSNSKYRARIEPGELAISKYYNLSKEETENKINEITNVCIQVLKRMEKQGYLLGDAAVDFILDKSANLYLLEVQIDYAAEIKAFREEDEQRVLPFILSTPFEYAKALAGF